MKSPVYRVPAAPLGTVDTPLEITVNHIEGTRKGMACFWCNAPAIDKVARTSSLDQKRRVDPACVACANRWARYPGARDLRV